MTLGNDIFDAIKASTSARSVTLDETFEDDMGDVDEFTDDGFDAGLKPFGVQKRPNGQDYHPRKIGTVEDIALIRDARDHFEHVLLYGPPGTGKLLPLDTPIPTPEGWTTMGELKPGSMVLGRDGKPTRVVYTSPVDLAPRLYRITLSDGQTVTACADHQWLVSVRKDRVNSRTRALKVRRRDDIAARQKALAALSLKNDLPERSSATELHQMIANLPALPWGSPNSVSAFLKREGLIPSTATRNVTQTVRRINQTRTLPMLVEVFETRTALTVMAQTSRAAMHTQDDSPERVLTTQQMVDMGVRCSAKDERLQFSVRLADSLDLPTVDLPLDPYVLGAWLGDGHIDYQHGASITSGETGVVNEIVRAGFDLARVHSDPRSSAQEFCFDDLGNVLRGMEITSKRIPTMYLRASMEQRLALLQGLMDTDGTVARTGACEIALSDEGLAEDVHELIRTLGIRVNKLERDSGYRDANGEYHECKSRYRMHFTTTLPVFRLPRKAVRIPERVRATQRWLYVTNIEPTESVPGKCIQVDNSDHMYLCGTGFLPTHNTALAEAVAFMDAIENDEAVGKPDVDPYIHMGFESIVCGVDTTEGDFFGTYVQNPENGFYEWNDGPLVRALRYGIPLYVDEIFLCDTRVLSSTLYPVMDGRTFLTVPMNPRLGRIPVTPGFFVIGAGNPNVPGADYSEALRSRFVHQIEVTSDWDLTKRLGAPQDILTVAKSLDVQRRNNVISWSPQTRDLIAYHKATIRYGREFAVAGLLGKTPFEDRPVVQKALEAAFGGKVTPLAMGMATSKSRR